MTRSNYLLIIDYLVFIIMVIVTIAVPIFRKCKGPGTGTKADYVFSAASKVSIGAMLLSLARGVLGVRSFLGYPSELYYHGPAMFDIIYGMIVAYPITAYCFVPVYYNLRITSIYQYLDMRFQSQTVRSLASGIYILRNVLNTGVTVFTPCVALKTIIGFPHWISIIGIVTISIICAVMGGLKAAIHADVIQGMISIACGFLIIIQGTIEAGGVYQTYKTNYDRGRLEFFNFDLNPTLRVATVSAFFGQLFSSTTIFGCQQIFLQRYFSMGSLKIVQRTLWLSMVVMFLLFTLFWLVGMVIFANYAGCDPFSLGLISKIDEIVPFYIYDKFGNIPGLIGVFMASLFNGSLSLTINNLNSLATVAWEDFVFKLPYFKHFKDRQQLLAIKTLVLIVGLLIMGVAFGIALLPGVIESSQLMTSATTGSLLGVFLLAMYFPASNWKGAVCGMISSLIITLWLTLGRILTRTKFNDFLPLSVDNCTNETYLDDGDFRFNISSIQQNILLSGNKFRYSHEDSANETLPAEIGSFSIYAVTYMYYSIFGTGICIFLGLIVSYLSGTTKNCTYSEKLIHPIALKISKLMPGKSRIYENKNETNIPDTTETNKECPSEKLKEVDIKLKNIHENSRGEIINEESSNNEIRSS